MEIANKMFSKLFGTQVGTDEFGNLFYESNSLGRYFGRSRRWVIYNGIPEATKIGVSWYSWLHHQDDNLPKQELKHKWIKARDLNLSGTKLAYFPPGNFFSKEKTKPKSTGDYTAWKPNVK